MAKRRRFVVGVAETDRVYGGPEEGGWYYDCGEPAKKFSAFTRVFKSERKAYRYLNKLQDMFEKIKMPDVSSVCYDGGHYSPILQIGEQLRPYPVHRPRYE